MLQNILLFVEQPAALWALLTWPRFSLTSYRMLTGLRRQGIAPRTILDVGANTGQFAVAAARLFPGARLIAFEPVAASFHQLERSLRGAGEVRQLVLSNTAGTVQFHVNANSRSSSVLPIGQAHLEAFPASVEVDAVTLPASTLDVELQGVPLASPSLLKLDVQGYEAQVLAGAPETLRRIDFVILEASFSPLYVGERPFLELVRIMDEHGFNFLRPVGWLNHPETGQVLQIDALFQRR